MNNKKSFKKSFSSRSFRMGAYQTVISAIVIVAIIVLNLVVTKADISVDLTSNKKYTLTDDSKKLIKDLKDNITIYYIVQDGQESSHIEKVLNQYSSVGSKIKVVKKDPIVYPKFASQYTSDEVKSNDAIVVNEDNKKVEHVSAADMVQSSVDYTNYTQTQSLDAEGQLTAAIQAVSSAKRKKVYMSKGHDETELSSSLKDLLAKSNVELKDTRLDGTPSIPKDCDILIINAPTYDLNEVEFKGVKSYLEAGGKAVLTMNPLAESKDQNNYVELLKEYGLDVKDGYVLEDSEHCYSDTVMAVIPTVKTHTITEKADSEKNTIVLGTKGFAVQKDVRGTLKIESLMETSKNSFSRVDTTASSLTKIAGDIAGPFVIGAAVTDDYRGNPTKLVVFGSSSFTSSTQNNLDLISSDQYNNRSIILGAINWLSGEETQSLAIPVRSLDQPLVEVPEKDRGFWIVALIVVLPLLFLAGGFVVWYRRRKS